MIRNQWYAILTSFEVPIRRAVGVRRLGENLVLWRDAEGVVQCIHDRCCHRGASLGAGKVVEGHVQCPFHGFEFDGQGKVRLIPANGKSAPIADNFKVRAFVVREAHDFVFLWWGEPRAELPEIPWFEDLGDDFSGRAVIDPWPTHYTRCVENQLDGVHLPFVHATTIGMGNRTVVHGPATVVHPDGLEFHVRNEVDDGRIRAQLPDDVKPDASLPHIEFLMPNLWQNWISSKYRVFAAFAPVDDEATVVYICTLQRVVRFPVLRWIVDWINLWISRIILAQDKRVVITQEPKRTWLAMGENLIPGDRPIVAFRKMRQDRLDKEPGRKP